MGAVTDTKFREDFTGKNPINARMPSTAVEANEGISNQVPHFNTNESGRKQEGEDSRAHGRRSVPVRFHYNTRSREEKKQQE